jgi:DNA-binding response OmpR family regulator/DNA-binding CsgD family transcriptional regulator
MTGAAEKKALDAALDRTRADLVLIVDDVPDNLAVLHDALDESGYTVLVASSGEAAIARAGKALPDIVLLDAMMPGMDGFEVARRLKADSATAHIPIIFMTGLTETEHLEAALAAGGVDYVTKPIKPREVLARMGVHLRSARLARQTRNALDAFGYASITVRASDGRITWQTSLARSLLQTWFAGEMAARPGQAPQAIVDWLRRHLQDAVRQIEPPRLSREDGARRLTVRLHRQTGDTEADDAGGEWLIVMREESDAAAIAAIGIAFTLTAREAEVLYWVSKGKINRDIADIVGASPATVKKHLERVYMKLGVETRTAASAMALGRLRQIQPQAQG